MDGGCLKVDLGSKISKFWSRDEGCILHGFVYRFICHCCLGPHTLISLEGVVVETRLIPSPLFEGCSLVSSSFLFQSRLHRCAHRQTGKVEFPAFLSPWKGESTMPEGMAPAGVEIPDIITR